MSDEFPNSIISALSDFISKCTLLQEDAPFYVDYLSGTETSYSIVPLPNDKILAEYINGGSQREYAFAFQFGNLTADNAERIANSEFNEHFTDWLEQKTHDEDLPVLPEGMTCELIEAVQDGFLYQEGESGTSIYQINCRLQYEQQPKE